MNYWNNCHARSHVDIDIDQGIYKVKLKVALNEKRKKLHGFSFSINMANFEAFWGVKTLAKTSYS